MARQCNEHTKNKACWFHRSLSDKALELFDDEAAPVNRRKSTPLCVIGLVQYPYRQAAASRSR